MEEAAAAEAAAEAEAEERDTESKTRTPHKDVGNNPTWWLIPRIVSGLVHPSLFSELTRSLSHVNHWGELTHLLSG